MIDHVPSEISEFSDSVLRLLQECKRFDFLSKTLSMEKSDKYGLQRTTPEGSLVKTPRRSHAFENSQVHSSPHNFGNLRKHSVGDNGPKSRSLKIQMRRLPLNPEAVLRYRPKVS